MKRSSLLAAVVAILLGHQAVTGQGRPRAVPREFANVKSLGRAATEFNDARIQIVAAYYHSQRNHESSWLLIELGAMGKDSTRIHRNQIELLTPGGRVVPLATQERWGSQTERNVLLMQQASASRHQVASYFRNITGPSDLRFFVQPSGTGTVVDIADLPRDRLMLGDLLFEAPTRIWEKGTHALVVRYEGGEAMLPIELQ